MKTLRIFSFLLFAICLCLSNLNAQTYTSEPIAFGFKGGLHYAKANLQNQSIDAFADISNIRTIAFGGFAEIPMTNQLAFQPEINFVKKGFSTGVGVDFTLFNFPLEVGARAETEVKYLELPILLKYKFGNEQLKGYVIGGPTVGYAMSGKLKTVASLLIDITVNKTDINLKNDNFQRFEVGGLIGIGGEWSAGAGALFADVRYHHGFTNMLNDPIIDAQLTNQGFGINIGYKFYLN